MEEITNFKNFFLNVDPQYSALIKLYYRSMANRESNIPVCLKGLLRSPPSSHSYPKFAIQLTKFPVTNSASTSP